MFQHKINKHYISITDANLFRIRYSKWPTVMYDEMLEKDMFRHLLALNPPNLVEIQPKQNLL